MRAVLTYHSIDDSGSPISVSREQFRAHCAFLGSGRVQVVPLQTLLELPGETDAVAITFDDGFANFLSDAAPQLERHALQATVFVVSDHVGGHNDWGGAQTAGIPHLPLMDWDQLARARDGGHTIGTHTRTHPRLPSIGAARRADELDGCVAHIRDRLGVEADLFAYPYGAVDEASAGAVRERFAAAFTTELRALRAGEDRALLPRLDMFYLRSAGLLERWGSTAFRSLLWMRSRGRRVRELLTNPLAPMGHVA
ncbi:MAG: polysaccharide deacetylase family protein [Gemmatimonadaceae bacterium]